VEKLEENTAEALDFVDTHALFFAAAVCLFGLFIQGPGERSLDVCRVSTLVNDHLRLGLVQRVLDLVLFGRVIEFVVWLHFQFHTFVVFQSSRVLYQFSQALDRHENPAGCVALQDQQKDDVQTDIGEKESQVPIAQVCGD
jgi:hypothetical protein